MWLFYMTIPLFALAVLGAAVPLLVASRREVHELVHEADARFERHRREHAGRRRTTSHAASRAVAGRPQNDAPRQRPWHEPVLVEQR